MAKTSTPVGHKETVTPDLERKKPSTLLAAIDAYTAKAAARMSEALTHCCAIHASADSPGPCCAWSLDQQGNMKIEWSSVHGAARSNPEAQETGDQPNAT